MQTSGAEDLPSEGRMIVTPGQDGSGPSPATTQVARRGVPSYTNAPDRWAFL